MKTIWKFPFEITDHQHLEIPVGAKPLHAGLDHTHTPCLWCLLDSTKETKAFDLYIVVTGHPVPPEAKTHLGTFVWAHTGTVWHVFGT